MHFKNIVSLSENGLLLDTFNENCHPINALAYIIKSRIMLYHDKENIHIFDRLKNETIKSYKINDIKHIKMSSNEKIYACLTYNKELTVFDYEKILYKYRLVESYDISNDLIFVFQENTLKIYNLNSNTQIESIDHVVEFSCFDNKVLLTSRKNKKEKMSFIYLEPSVNKTIFHFDNIERFQAKVNKANDMFLISITTQYMSNSYFGVSSLFLLNTDDKKLKEINLKKPILFYDFCKNGILICHGDQPSSATILNKNLTTIKIFPKGIRNRAYFNPHENLICFAGFDNLNGMIEIYSNELLSKFKVLGASKIFWSPNGSYFLVGTTNELKVDNKIQLFDYYGNEIACKNFDNLISVEWIGEKEDFIPLKKEKKNILDESVYIPPHLRNENKGASNIITNKKKTPKNVIKKQEEKIDIEKLRNDLREIELLKNKIENGESLDIESLNKILKEDEIKSKLKNHN